MKQLLRNIGVGTFGMMPPERARQEFGEALVLNERAVRAGAGIMFVLGSFAFYQALLAENYLPLSIVAPFFFFDFCMKVLVGQPLSPIGQLAKRLVRGQRPEFVLAAPKRFAWGIGMVLSGTISLLLLFGVTGPLNFAVCVTCLVIMFLETSFAICLGCLLYRKMFM
jgi:hypothetical protein